MTFYLLDKIVELSPGRSIKAVKCWSLDNTVFEYHFPYHPVVPGVLLTESMAQMLGVLIEKSYASEYSETARVYPILVLIEKAKFKNFVRPGDQCFIEGELSNLDRGRASGRARVMVESTLMAEATLVFALGALNPEKHRDSRLDDYHKMILAGLEAP